MEHLLFIGSVQALFTALFLITKPVKAVNDIILGTWMIFLALPLMAGAAVQTWPDVRIPILRSDLVYPLTYGPFLWLYVGTLTGDVGRITPRQLVHFLPFVLLSVFQILLGWAPAPPNPEDSSFSMPIRVIGAVNLGVLLAYTTAVFVRLSRHDQNLLAHYSELRGNITLGWLKWMTAWLSGVFLLLFLAAFLSIPELLNVHLFALVASILGLSFFGLRQSQVFVASADQRKITTGSSKVSNDAGQKSKTPRYDRSGLTQERAEEIANRLRSYMRAERPYLDADITIEVLAKQISVRRHYLTEVISEYFGKNFYLFVNEFRIEAVKQALSDPTQADRTLLDIAYSSGFNSKSAFNAAFKKLTGTTPSQFRRQLH